MQPGFANEQERTLAGDSFAAAPNHILEGVDGTLAHLVLPGAPRSIYAELWHITFWQQISLDWVSGVTTPADLASSCGGFPERSDRKWVPQISKRCGFPGLLKQARQAGSAPLLCSGCRHSPPRLCG